MAHLTSTDVAKVAYDIEVLGQVFYKHAVDITEDDQLKELFQFLYEEEKRHEDVFKRMLGTLENLEEKAGVFAPDDDFIRTLYEHLIFDDSMFEEIKNNIKTPKDVLNFALDREKDTVLLFRELEDYLPDNDRGEIDIIINEERKHYLKLKEALKNFHK